MPPFRLTGFTLVAATAAVLPSCRGVFGIEPLHLALDSGGATDSPTDGAGDAGDADDRRDTGACAPTVAFNASPPGLESNACNLDRALIADGEVTGLSDIGGTDTLAGKSVAGCVGVEFPAALTSTTIRAASSAGQCGASCSPGYCGKGDTAAVFAGSALGSYVFIQSLTLTPTLEDEIVPLPPSMGARFVVVCREGYGPGSDDVAVDAVAGACP